tara:strand:- start:2370 stop:2630 length:261 start_codon:yes stop_codon:yes gene_type:complete
MKIKMIKILYFSWLRENIGVSEEIVETSAKSIEELVEELKLKSDRYKLAFANLDNVKVAMDQRFVNFKADIKNPTEIAFFPPMTGG